MRALLDRHPELRTVTLMRVDWDRFSRSEIVLRLSIPRRSTLVAFRDGKEVDRIVAQTDPARIEALFRAAL